jgi:hypothetical protein
MTRCSGNELPRQLTFATALNGRSIPVPCRHNGSITSIRPKVVYQYSFFSRRSPLGLRLRYHSLFLHPAFRPGRQHLVAQLAQLLNHPPFCGVGLFTVTRRILDHSKQAFHAGAQLRMTI